MAVRARLGTTTKQELIDTDILGVKKNLRGYVIGSCSTPLNPKYSRLKLGTVKTKTGPIHGVC